MGPFSENKFVIKTLPSNGSRPTTSTNIPVSFNKLCKTIQMMRRAGFTITAINLNSPIATPPTLDTAKVVSTKQKGEEKKVAVKSDPKDKKTATRRGKRKA